MISNASCAFSGRGNWIAMTLSLPYCDLGEERTIMETSARISKNLRSVFALTRNFSEILAIEKVKRISTKHFPTHLESHLDQC